MSWGTNVLPAPKPFSRSLMYAALSADLQHRVALRAGQGIGTVRPRREEVDADGCELGRWKRRLEPPVGVQPRFPCAVQEVRQLDEILIREPVRAVVGDGRSLVQIGRGHVGWQRVQLQRDQAEA